MTFQPIPLDVLNDCPQDRFQAVLGPVFENAPWVCDMVWHKRPFASLTMLHDAMMQALRALEGDRLIAFLNGHPRLSPETLRKGTTAESTGEQTSAGLNALDPETTGLLGQLNDAYEARFGFPFILAVRNASLETMLASFQRRIGASPAAEREEALAEIRAISWMRLLDRVTPATSGGLSTHVLDTVRAAPAAGIGIELWKRLPSGNMECLATHQTDQQGQFATNGDWPVEAGDYEWHFDTPTYFARQGYATVERTYLGKVRIAFSVWNPEEHYHVPLLLTPGSYTTYRGN
ncbi:Uric acid degradation bifunctional protein [Hartmannibacter diazotrophicus]|uniref:Uric acid degradation bifunctional protein n=1 Tax=Hartmannibacter diazotrophicus TaxID=1482074 RepID=A0A2C9D981_9HYPH|nr:2-oxo-4-hydroxy-4-carboxy-5-ureidoimidazoline decarboxylase [Hartmannibacter diazotrophicus]SON56749.1 Uric acid degradation bifunctional protein [Hartmannibacter diazotrophicus]